MTAIWKLGISAGALFLLAQMVRPTIPVETATAEIQAPSAVRRILGKSCYSCHSDESRLAWFDEVEPAYLIARHDIVKARSRLNFSSLGSASPTVQRAKLFEAVNMIRLGAMPLPQFVALHRDAKVSPEDIAQLKAYLAPWATLPSKSMHDSEIGWAAARISLSVVRPEPDGLALDPSFANWKLISITDRGDNNTFRFILGNDVAVEAAQYWFGARIPDIPQRVEFVQVSGHERTEIYRAYEGNALAESYPTAVDARRRASFILSLKPVSLP